MTEILHTQVPGLTLRFANREDVAQILAFIRELADYEHLSHEVTADEALLEHTLFGERRVAEVLLAEHDARPAGFALFFHNFSTFLGRPGIYLEDLYVRPAHRGAGVGQAFLAAIARLALERGCGRVDWSVLDWNESAIGFYRKLGAVPMDGWVGYRVTGAALEALAAEGETRT